MKISTKSAKSLQTRAPFAGSVGRRGRRDGSPPWVGEWKGDTEDMAMQLGMFGLGRTDNDTTSRLERCGARMGYLRTAVRLDPVAHRAARPAPTGNARVPRARGAGLEAATAKGRA
jgi:hypothetical protein